MKRRSCALSSLGNRHLFKRHPMEYPSCHGTYILFLRVDHEFSTQVGALGWLDFKCGIYAYVGSAFGPGGLRARLGHHLSPEHGNHWHIDYLSQKADVDEIWYTCDPARREHEWAEAFAGQPGSSSPISGFGASDCQCSTHLFHLPVIPRSDDFYERLQKRYPGHEPITRLLLESELSCGAESEYNCGSGCDDL
jgi:Uri superfamily endonuclease